jgi:hypothetical protein
LQENQKHINNTAHIHGTQYENRIKVLVGIKTQNLQSRKETPKQEPQNINLEIKIRNNQLN